MVYIMKKTLIYAILITTVILCIGGCGKKNEQEESAPDVVEDKEPQEEPEEDTLEPVSEKGNPYNFDEKYLGYYSNNYWGMDLKQIDGENLIVDVYEYGYLLDENNPYPILDSKTFNVYGDYTLSEFDVIFNDDGTFQLTEEQATCVNNVMMMSYTSDLSYIDNVNGYYHDANAKNLGTMKFFKSDDKPDDTKKIDWAGYYEEHENTQVLSNRRDNELYPKYIKHIPQHSVYICGDPEADDYFWLLEINTRPLYKEYSAYYDIDNPYMYQASLNLIYKDDDGGYTASTYLNFNRELKGKDFRMYSFGYAQTESIGFLDEYYNEDDIYPNDKYGYFILDCADQKNIILKTNIISASYNQGEEEKTIELEDESVFLPASVDEIKDMGIQIEVFGGESWYKQDFESWYNFDFSQVVTDN